MCVKFDIFIPIPESLLVVLAGHLVVRLTIVLIILLTTPGAPKGIPQSITSVNIVQKCLDLNSTRNFMIPLHSGMGTQCSFDRQVDVISFCGM